MVINNNEFSLTQTFKAKPFSNFTNQVYNRVKTNNITRNNYKKFNKLKHTVNRNRFCHTNRFH